MEELGAEEDSMKVVGFLQGFGEVRAVATMYGDETDVAGV